MPVIRADRAKTTAPAKRVTSESNWSIALFEPKRASRRPACHSGSRRSPQRPTSSRPECSWVARTTEQVGDWALSPIRTVTKLMLTNRRPESNMLAYKRFHDCERHRGDHGEQIPSRTDSAFITTISR